MITSPKKPGCYEEEEEDKEAASEASEEEERDYENQYTLIFPSTRNPEYQYDEYLAYATKCYEKFTGSYSKESRDAAALKK